MSTIAVIEAYSKTKTAPTLQKCFINVESNKNYVENEKKNKMKQKTSLYECPPAIIT